MRTIKAEKPAYLFTVAGLRFYEHPTKGDESPMLVRWNSIFIDSGFYDTPEGHEVEDLLIRLKQRNPVPLNIGLM